MTGQRQQHPAMACLSQACRPRVVILGAGFGGLSAAKALKNAPVDVILVDRHNYHLFQPLLYQVATASLSPNQVAVPVRQILSRQPNATVLMDTVFDVDLDNQEVVTRGGRISYDHLVVATGARHAYFGHDEWEQAAPGLKKIEEATDIRRRLLVAFERAEVETSPERRRSLLTFAVVGGGPTGVELAGAIAELARKSLVRDFRHIDPALARVVLVEAGTLILPNFPRKLSNSAHRQLAALGVEIITGDAVVHCDDSGLRLRSGTRIDAGTVVWGAGVMASPAAQWLGAGADRAGRVKVCSRLKLPGRENVYVIGDTASVTDGQGRIVPGVAPAAKQMGQYVARAILAALAGKQAPAFVYSDYGNLATIGRKSAVADFGRIQLSGFPAWVVWGLVHIGFLIGFRNRLTVMLDWTWSYLSHARGVRLITGHES